ncbi:hypothetical protein [Nostoc sp.]|uniref:hypothetical protein n=1 Tax=Nostoc sp. TaxID=1180 RepID=UPI002FF3FAB7
MKPTEVGFVCVDAVSNRPFRVKLTPMKPLRPYDWSIYLKITVRQDTAIYRVFAISNFHQKTLTEPY